jgi:hypothetical protein
MVLPGTRSPFKRLIVFADGTSSRYSLLQISWAQQGGACSRCKRLYLGRYHRANAKAFPARRLRGLNRDSFADIFV